MRRECGGRHLETSNITAGKLKAGSCPVPSPFFARKPPWLPASPRLCRTSATGRMLRRSKGASSVAEVAMEDRMAGQDGVLGSPLRSGSFRLRQGYAGQVGGQVGGFRKDAPRLPPATLCVALRAGGAGSFTLFGLRLLACPAPVWPTK